MLPKKLTTERINNVLERKKERENKIICYHKFYYNFSRLHSNHTHTHTHTLYIYIYIYIYIERERDSESERERDREREREIDRERGSVIRYIQVLQATLFAEIAIHCSNLQILVISRVKIKH